MSISISHRIKEQRKQIPLRIRIFVELHAMIVELIRKNYNMRTKQGSEKCYNKAENLAINRTVKIMEIIQDWEKDKAPIDTTPNKKTNGTKIRSKTGK